MLQNLVAKSRKYINFENFENKEEIWKTFKEYLRKTRSFVWNSFKEDIWKTFKESFRKSRSFFVICLKMDYRS